MNDLNCDEDIYIKNRIIYREHFIKKLGNKYIELLTKFNTMTRNEMAKYIKEIIGELENIEISILKAESIDKLKEIDIEFHRNLSIEIENKLFVLFNEIEENNSKLVEEKIQKEYKKNCEDLAKVINSYNSKDELEK